MSYSCLDHLAHLSTLDVVAICARDTVDLAAFSAGVVAEALAGAIVLLKLVAFPSSTGSAGSRGGGCRLVPRTFRGPELRTVVERHRGRPAEVGVERAAPP